MDVGGIDGTTGCLPMDHFHLGRRCGDGTAESAPRARTVHGIFGPLVDPVTVHGGRGLAPESVRLESTIEGEYASIDETRHDSRRHRWGILGIQYGLGLNVSKAMSILLPIIALFVRT